jgi:hypothetical protein
MADNPRHGTDGLGATLSGADKQWLDQIGSAENGLPHQGTHGGCGAIAPHPAKKI